MVDNSKKVLTKREKNQRTILCSTSWASFWCVRAQGFLAAYWCVCGFNVYVEVVCLCVGCICAVGSFTFPRVFVCEMISCSWCAWAQGFLAAYWCWLCFVCLCWLFVCMWCVWVVQCMFAPVFVCEIKLSFWCVWAQGFLAAYWCVCVYVCVCWLFVCMWCVSN